MRHLAPSDKKPTQKGNLISHPLGLRPMAEHGTCCWSCIAQAETWGCLKGWHPERRAACPHALWQAISQLLHSTGVCRDGQQCSHTALGSEVLTPEVPFPEEPNHQISRYLGTLAGLRTNISALMKQGFKLHPKNFSFHKLKPSSKILLSWIFVGQVSSATQTMFNVLHLTINVIYPFFPYGYFLQVLLIFNLNSP